LIRCARCILPYTYPGIKFNEKGICNKCIEYKKRKKEDYRALEIKLKKLFNHYKHKNRTYDCLVGISGGKDSTYTLYFCKEICKMNVLAVNFDNGFMSSQALKNIQKIIDKLNVDYISYKPNWNLMKRLYSHFLLTIGDFCTPCAVGVKATLFRIAKKEKIPLIVSGGSKYEVIPPEVAYHSQNTFKNVIRGKIPLNEVNSFLYPLVYKKFIRYINLSDYIYWNEEEILRTIRDNLGWSEGSYTSVDHFDCIAHTISDYLWLQKWGFSRKTLKYSIMIREGEMDRETALRKIAIEESKKEPEEMNFFLERLNLTKEDFYKSIYKNGKFFYEKDTIKIIAFAKKIIAFAKNFRP